jgi:hypothetical protein
MAHADIHSGIHAGIHADTHVFGSTRGYGTVASSRGVRDEEARELESFQFGEASTADRIARLETHAVMTGRALRSGRFAISRMMPAGVDDAGRPTVEVVTLVVEARDYEACAGALPMLADDAAFWRGARASAASGTRVPAIAPVADANDPRVFRLFDLWRAAVRAGAAGVVPETESDSVLRLVASLDPVDRARCRWGIGLLSISAPADLCSIASGTSTHGARDVLRPAQSGAWHCGNESEYAAFRVTSGLARFPSTADIEVNGRELGVQDWATGAAATAQPKRTEKRPKSLLPLAIGSAVMSTAVLAVALVMWDRRGGGDVNALSLGSGSDGKAVVQAQADAKDQLNEAIQIPPHGSLETPPKPSDPTPASLPEPSSTPATPTGTLNSSEPVAAPPPEPPPSPASPTQPVGEASPSPTVPTEKPNDRVESPKNYTQPEVTLAALLAELRSAPVPERRSGETDGAYNERVKEAVDEWIRIAHRVNLLDRTCKEAASARPEWVSRKDDPDWESTGIVEVVAIHSGFIATWNGRLQYDAVPLNSGARGIWKELATELRERVTRVHKRVIDARKLAVRDNLLGPKDLPDFRPKLLAWERGIDLLLDPEKLKDEINSKHNI